MRVAESLRQLFLDKQTKCIFLAEAIELLQERLYGQFIESNEIKRVVVNICKILPSWCMIVSIPKGILLRCEGRDKNQIG